LSRDEYPCIRYRRKLDFSLENRKFNTAAEFAAEGGWDAGWARSPKEVEPDPHNPRRKPAAPVKAVSPEPKPAKRTKPAAATE
jgi:hypothetical protein